MLLDLYKEFVYFLMFYNICYVTLTSTQLNICAYLMPNQHFFYANKVQRFNEDFSMVRTY